jgi:hypothetical protein
MIGLISRKLSILLKIKVMTKGSSETTREAFCFDLFFQYKPEQKKNIKSEFLQWFIGFSEGDCTFHTWVDRGRKRAGFTIDQKDPKVLFWIRENLGFGKVLPCTGGWRFQVWDQKGLFLLFCLFSGNIVLDKRHLTFQKWSTFLVFPQGFSVILESCSSFQAKKNSVSGAHLVSLHNAWFSGFWQANGGFSAWGSFLSKTPHIILRTYLTQRSKETALEKIGLFVQGSEKKLVKTTNGKTSTKDSRLEFASESCLETMVGYFTKFPLVGEKHIVFLRWKRVWEARERLKKGKFVKTEKSLTKLKRLIAAVKKTK